MSTIKRMRLIKTLATWAWFSLLILRQLWRNRHKTHWTAVQYDYLVAAGQAKYNMIFHCIPYNRSPYFTILLLADVAAYLMILADKERSF